MRFRGIFAIAVIFFLFPFFARGENVMIPDQGLLLSQIQERLFLVSFQVQIIFGSSLERGQRGDDIRQFQEFLAKDPSLYPEGLVTGYFGPLTERAFHRLQARHGFPPMGVLNARTLAAVMAEEAAKPNVVKAVVMVSPAPVSESLGSPTVSSGSGGGDSPSLSSPPASSETALDTTTSTTSNIATSTEATSTQEVFVETTSIPTSSVVSDADDDDDDGDDGKKDEKEKRPPADGEEKKSKDKKKGDNVTLTLASLLEILSDLARNMRELFR